MEARGIDGQESQRPWDVSKSLKFNIKNKKEGQVTSLGYVSCARSYTLAIRAAHHPVLQQESWAQNSENPGTEI